MNLAIDRVVSCVSEISCWMEQNDLRLSPDKTDILLIHSRFREGPALDYLQFMDERISISDKVRSLGVIFDKHMMFDDQIDHVCKSSINHLRNFFRIRTYLDVNTASTVIHAFITTRLDYCNHLYFGLPKYKVKKLQQIQNIAQIAARYVTGARKYDHITPILVQLHWLPVSYRIVFKHLLFVYKSLNGLCPQYLTNLLEHRKSARSLRSNVQDLLIQQFVKPKHMVIEPLVFVLRNFGTLFLWKHVNPVQSYYFKTNLRPSFLLDILRVTLYIFNFFSF